MARACSVAQGKSWSARYCSSAALVELGGAVGGARTKRDSRPASPSAMRICCCPGSMRLGSEPGPTTGSTSWSAQAGRRSARSARITPGANSAQASSGVSAASADDAGSWSAFARSASPLGHAVRVSVSGSAWGQLASGPGTPAPSGGSVRASGSGTGVGAGAGSLDEAGGSGVGLFAGAEPLAQPRSKLTAKRAGSALCAPEPALPEPARRLIGCRGARRRR